MSHANVNNRQITIKGFVTSVCFDCAVCTTFLHKFFTRIKQRHYVAIAITSKAISIDINMCGSSPECNTY